MEQVAFKTSIFPKYPTEDHEIINSNRWGKRLAEYLHRQLLGHGIETMDIFPEDWGWLVEVHHEDFNSFVGCGVADESDEEFVVFIEVKQPFFKRIFSKKDPEPFIQEISESLNIILKSNSAITDIEWS